MTRPARVVTWRLASFGAPASLCVPDQVKKAEGDDDGGAVPLGARIFRGLDNLRTVSEATHDDNLTLRPGENLGVHLGLIKEYLDTAGTVVQQVHNAVGVYTASRLAFGYEHALADTTLPNADGIYIRIGTVPHFELRLEVVSIASRAIAKALIGIERLSDRQGSAEILKGLQKESASQLQGQSNDDGNKTTAAPGGCYDGNTSNVNSNIVDQAAGRVEVGARGCSGGGGAGGGGGTGSRRIR
eukprot:g11009.t1